MEEDASRSLQLRKKKIKKPHFCFLDENKLERMFEQKKRTAIAYEKAQSKSDVRD